MVDFDGLLEIANQLKVVGLGAAGLKVGQWLFRIQKGDIPTCNTRIMRTRRGLPWNEQIGVHPLEDGRLQLTPIREEPTNEEDAKITTSEFYQALKKVSQRKLAQESS